MREGNTQGTQGYHQLPAGPTSGRPSPAVAGMMRWNTTLLGWDLYDGAAWSTHCYDTLTGSDSVASAPNLFIYDPARTKYLSAQGFALNYQSPQVATDDYIFPGDLNFSADVGVIMPFNGTVVSLTAFATNVNKTIRSFGLFVDLVETPNLLQFGSTTLATYMIGSNTAVNLDFNAGQSIRMRSHLVAGNTGNRWTNLSIMLYYKWRK